MPPLASAKDELFLVNLPNRQYQNSRYNQEKNLHDEKFSQYFLESAFKYKWTGVDFRFLKLVCTARKM